MPHTLVKHWIDTRDDERDSLVAYRDEALKPFFQHIRDTMPYYNRSSGRDHIFIYAMDEGPQCEEHGWRGTPDLAAIMDDALLRPMIHSMIQVGYYGRHGGKTLFDGPQRRTCWKANSSLGGDIGVPMFNQMHATRPPPRPWPHHLHAMASDLYFRGQIISGHTCSPGVRPLVDDYFKGGCQQVAAAPPNDDEASDNDNASAHGASAVLVYRGCFRNDVAKPGRIEGHVGNKRAEDCRALAAEAGKRFFGMEWPEGFREPGRAQCLLLDGLTPSDRTADAECEAEHHAQSQHRLGAEGRLAVYEEVATRARPRGTCAPMISYPRTSAPTRAWTAVT